MNNKPISADLAATRSRESCEHQCIEASRGLDGCQGELSDLSIKIDALKAIDAAENATPSQVGPERTTPQGPPA